MTSELRELVPVPMACGLLDHQHLAARQSQRAGNGEADDTRPGNNAIDVMHGPTLALD